MGAGISSESSRFCRCLVQRISRSFVWAVAHGIGVWLCALDVSCKE
ncbi:short chain dehydrogenase [Moniliophthora roreri]|nr:short chain dehydrogenase [Moniliophthora roreri]